MNYGAVLESRFFLLQKIDKIEMMKYLGIDYGKKRIGVALSDDEGKLAFPYSIVDSVRDVMALIKKEVVKKIVIGLPITFSGKESKQTKEVRQFAEKLENKVALLIEFENEMLTTKMASSEGDSKHIDASSAAIILQSYLDRENQKLK